MKTTMKKPSPMRQNDEMTTKKVKSTKTTMAPPRPAGPKKPMSKKTTLTPAMQMKKSGMGKKC
jgi:hypothetical protein